jgi:molecular chaperone Hsp33
MKEPYVGSIKLISGEIGDDVTAYFVQSEQTPTACALGVLVDRDYSVKVAGGYLVQLLPGAPDDVIDRLENGIKRAGAVTKMLEAGLTPEDILGQVCGELGVVFMETTEVSYKCYCSRDRVTSALISLGREELEEIKAEGKTFPVECQFCDTMYEFTPEDIAELLKKI